MESIKDSNKKVVSEQKSAEESLATIVQQPLLKVDMVTDENAENSCDYFIMDSIDEMEKPNSTTVKSSESFEKEN